MKNELSNTQTSTNILPPALLNTEEAAKFLGLKQSTLEKYRLNGNGPLFVKFKRSVRYKISDLLDYIDGKTYACTADYELGTYH